MQQHLTITTVTDNLAKRKWAHDLKEIHSVTADDKKLVIFIITKLGSEEIAIEGKTFTTGEANSSSSNSSSTETAEVYRVLLLNRVRAVWQRFFEVRIMPAPEVY
jgi:hypothetical protein